jgi:hypothetical protein
MTAVELNPSLRKLIDARLEAIDRILGTAGIAWSERRSIVGEVETQIYELLARRGPLPAAEDVLAVLASLDPPEAYIPDELREQVAGAPDTKAPAGPDWRQLPAQAYNLVVRLLPGAAVVVALVIVNGVVGLVIALSEGVIPWLVTLCCLAWLNYVGVRRYRAWSSKCRGNRLDELRQGLAAWLAPNHGAAAT